MHYLGWVSLWVQNKKIVINRKLEKNKIRRIMLQLFSLVMFSFFVIKCGQDNTPPTIEEKEDEEVVDSGGTTEPRDISSFDLVAEMGVGWNLGNSFDVRSGDKTLWGNPLPSKSIIDAVREMGFRTLRIPITWSFNQNSSSPYEIEDEYLSRVKKAVDYGFQNEMHVIVNVHHDDWVEPQASDIEEVKERLGSLWTQVANHFIEYNDSLIFETLNEPRLMGIPQEWTGGTAEGRGFVNDLNEVAVNAIRATGSNNEIRHIMIPTWAASTVPAAMDDLVIPNNDPKIIISLHSYFPWQFAGEAAIGWGSEADKANLQAELEQIRQKWIIEEQRPVILGEWGSIESNSLEDRLEYADFYAKEAASRGLLTIVWDDGGMFRMFNRHSLSWDYESIASTIVSSSE